MRGKRFASSSIQASCALPLHIFNAMSSRQSWDLGEIENVHQGLLKLEHFLARVSQRGHRAITTRPRRCRMLLHRHSDRSAGSAWRAFEIISKQFNSYAIALEPSLADVGAQR